MGFGCFHGIVNAKGECADRCEAGYPAAKVDWKFVVLNDVNEGLEIGVVECA